MKTLNHNNKILNPNLTNPKTLINNHLKNNKIQKKYIMYKNCKNEKK